MLDDFYTEVSELLRLKTNWLVKLEKNYEFFGKDDTYKIRIEFKPDDKYTYTIRFEYEANTNNISKIIIQKCDFWNRQDKECTRKFSINEILTVQYTVEKIIREIPFKNENIPKGTWKKRRF